MVDSDVLTAVSKVAHTGTLTAYIPRIQRKQYDIPLRYISLIEPSMGRHVGDLYNTSLDLDTRITPITLMWLLIRENSLIFPSAVPTALNLYTLGNVQLW